jgi:hypothetical protein
MFLNDLVLRATNARWAIDTWLVHATTSRSCFPAYIHTVIIYYVVQLHSCSLQPDRTWLALDGPPNDGRPLTSRRNFGEKFYRQKPSSITMGGTYLFPVSVSLSPNLEQLFVENAIMLGVRDGTVSVGRRSWTSRFSGHYYEPPRTITHLRIFL